jgi:soluble lytic murein transglycosylase-like protein
MDLSTTSSRLALVSKYAPKYGLQPSLVGAVCEQESDWYPWAVRFEPAFEARYIKPALPQSPSTLQLCEAMSFGLMQVMGEVAIEFGWTGRSLLELCDPDIGVLYGCRKLARCFQSHSDLEAALLSYNGGSNRNYPSLVIARLPRYSITATP